MQNSSSRNIILDHLNIVKFIASMTKQQLHRRTDAVQWPVAMNYVHSEKDARCLQTNSRIMSWHRFVPIFGRGIYQKP